ncbi:recombinase family protein [Streptomyces antibioticus]|uniref:recombinase family protein n=1 Tax=Streptomyces antibioticus TaxID=1890 RepID=UPI00225A46A5|nr:recombinase family protein [Streptomyces antibioticus]MCX4742800.1 recombinase family protein [Streptomyces antibioticus]
MRTDLKGQPAGIYLRISDDKEGRELGVARQEEDDRRLADQLGVNVVDVYKDNDISASTRTKKKRPDYRRLLRDAEAGRIKVIIAYTSARITRRPRENEDLIDLAEHHGTVFQYVASPAFDLNTANGRMVARILVASDAGMAETTAELITRKKQQRAENGQFHGGGRPYGYEKDGKTPRLCEIKVVMEAVRRLGAGESQASVIRSFNDRGTKTADGGLWAVGNFKRTVTKLRYVIFDDDDPERRGTREHSSGLYRAEWEGFVTRTAHALMMSQLEKSAQPWAHGLATGRKYLLSGLCVCGGFLASGEPCMASMYGQARKRENGTRQPRYRCKGRDNFAREVGCGKVFRDAEALDAFISEAVLARFDSPDIARVLTPKDDAAKVDELVKKLAGFNLRRQQLAAEHALKPYDDYDIMRATIMSAIGETEKELSKLHVGNVKHLLPADQPMRVAWENASVAWKRDIIKLLIERIIVHPGSPGGKTWNGYRFDPSKIEVIWRA